jgi:hypothetical protein
MNKETHKAIVSAKAFVKDSKTFESIVKLCALKPENDSWVRWHDDGNNILRIQKNNSFHIYPSSKISLGKITDLYRKSRPKYIAKDSHWAMFSFGYDEFDNEATIAWFIGNDERLRVSFFVEECWVENHLPLLSGAKILKKISEEKYSKEFRQINIPSSMNLNIQKTFTMSWPPSTRQLEKLELIQKSTLQVLKVCGI